MGEPFENSVSYSPLAPLELSRFSKPDSMAAYLMSEDPQSRGYPMWCLDPLLLRKDLCTCSIPIWVTTTRYFSNFLCVCVSQVEQDRRLALQERNVSCSILGPQDVSPISFPSKMFRQFVSSGHPEAGMPGMVHQSLTSQNCLQLLCYHAQGGVFCKMSLPLLS